MSRATRDADEQIEREASSDYMKSRRSLGRRLSEFIFGRTDKRYPPDQLPPFPVPGESGSGPAAPPVQPRSGKGGGGFIPPRPPRPPVGTPDPDEGDDEAFDDIEILGRDASYDHADWKVVMDQMRLTPGSTNVYGYYFEFESCTTGILYVTFLADYRGEKREGPGATYAYYTVPARKYHQFQEAAASSAGNAVWDFLRIRGTIWGHQHQYRLVQVHGDYIPRKATKKGYRTRHLLAIGETGRRSYRRSTLPERLFPAGGVDRGRPDRGEPDRGDSLP